MMYVYPGSIFLLLYFLISTIIFILILSWYYLHLHLNLNLYFVIAELIVLCHFFKISSSIVFHKVQFTYCIKIFILMHFYWLIDWFSLFFNLVNEPWDRIPMDVLKDFYWQSYQIVQNFAPHWITLLHDSFRLSVG